MNDVKRFASLAEEIARATQAYVAEVKTGVFPDEAHSFHSNTLRLVQPEEREDEPSVVGAPV